MQPALAGAVRVPPHEPLADQRAERRHDQQQHQHRVGRAVPILEDPRQEDLDPVVARHDEKVRRGQHQHLFVAQRHAPGHVAVIALEARFLARQFGRQRLALVGVEPERLSGPVGQEREDGHPQQHGRDAPGDVDPLPTFQAEDFGMVDQPAVNHLVGADPDQRAGEDWADRLRDRRGDQEPRQRPRPVSDREPVREINDHAWEKPRLRQAEQEPQAVELQRRRDQRRQGRHDPPGNHDPADPLAGAPLLDDQRAGNLQQEVAEEEDPRAEAHHLAGEGGHVLAHGQRGDRHVGAIHVRDYVAEEQQRQQPPVRLLTGAVQRRNRGGRQRHDDGARKRMALGWLRSAARPTAWHRRACRSYRAPRD